MGSGVGATWAWLEPGLAGQPLREVSRPTASEAPCAWSRGHIPHFLLRDPCPRLVSFLLMLLADPRRLGYWWLSGILRWGCQGQGWSRDPPNSVSLLLSPAASSTACFLPSVSVPVSLCLHHSRSLCPPPRRALLCHPAQTSFPPRALVSRSGALRVGGLDSIVSKDL